MTRSKRGVSWWLVAMSVLTGCWLLAPLLIVIPLSFTDSQSFNFPPEGWSLRWYEEFLTSPEWVNAFWNSVLLGLVVMVLATALGVLAAVAMMRATRRTGRVVNAVTMLPMMLPQIVVALAVYMTFLRWKLVGTELGFVLAHTCLAIPFVTIPVLTSLRGIDPQLGRAAASLGASRIETFRLVTLPLAAPGVLAGAVLAFATSFDEVVMSLYIQSPTLRTLPVQMYTSVTSETDPAVAAASVVVMSITTALLVVPFGVQMIRRRRGAAQQMSA